MTASRDDAPARTELPHNIDAEMAVLGSVFIRPSALDEAADLRVDDFFLPAHREIIDAMRTVSVRAAAGKAALDVMGVADELRDRGMLARLEGGTTYLDRCMNAVPLAENVKHYVRIVATKAVQRRLIAAAMQIQSAARGEFHDINDLLAESRSMLAGIEIMGGSEPTLIGADINDALLEIEDRALNPGSYFIRTGVRSFDSKIGGVRGEQLIIVAARPGMGKSAFVKDVLEFNAVNRVPSLLFSLEMSRREVQERCLSKEAQVNGHHILTGKLDGREWQRLSPAAAKMSTWPFWLYTDNVRAKRMCSMIRRWHAKLPAPPPVTEGQPKPKKLAVVGIDYLSLIELDDEDDNYARELGKITRMLKNLAKELDIPIILLCQLNRKIEEAKTQREPMLADLRDSGSIEQDANMVIFPWWEGDSPQTGSKDAYLIVGKNRGGAKGKCEVTWWPEFTTFADRDGDAYTLFDRTGNSGRTPYRDD